MSVRNIDKRIGEYLTQLGFRVIAIQPTDEDCGIWDGWCIIEDEQQRTKEIRFETAKSLYMDEADVDELREHLEDFKE